VTADRCEHCGVVVSADHQQVWRDGAGAAFCPTGNVRHDVPVNRTLVTPSPLLAVPPQHDPYGRLYQTYADPWGAV
jgi:hypothetical protein